VLGVEILKLLILSFQVNMEFVDSSVRPGSNTTIRVRGDPKSACSVGVVDKSINLLKADHQITPEKVHIRLK
jgi:hypothetical protein